MQSSKLLGLIVAMQSLILAGQWLGGGSGGGYVQPAMAQISDAGAQRIEMIAKLNDLNGKMDRLIQILESGELQVGVVMPDENKEGDSAR